MFGYKDTASHWFRTDGGHSYPSVDDYMILFSAREFKKTRVEYFVEHEFNLEETIPAK